MSKRNKIIYWIATIWLCLGMVSTAVVQLMRVEDEVQNFTGLGYPLYLMGMIACWKIAGSVAVLIPRFPILKEWAYAGFFFAMSGASISHIIVGDPASKIFPSVLLLVLGCISWFFRPPSKKAVAIDGKADNFTTA